MSSTSSIDVVIVTFNSGKFIRELIGSLSKIVGQDSIFIWDNKSSDQTVEIINNNFHKVHLYQSNENVGFAKAINNLVRKTNKEYVLIINPDTRPDLKAIEILLRCIKENNADIVGGKMVRKNGELHKSYVRIPNALTIVFDFTNLGKLFKNNRWHRRFYYLDTKIINTSVVDAVSGGYMLIRKKSFTELNGFDEKFFMYLEDIDLCRRANGVGMKILYCPDSKIIHIGGGSSPNIHKINYSAWDESRLYYVHKNFNGVARLFLTLLVDIDIAVSSIKRQ